MGAREVRLWVYVHHTYMIVHIPITLLMPLTYCFTVYGYFRASGASGVVPEGHMCA